MKILKNNNGFSIAMVLVTFMVVSILGLTTLPVATSENRLTRMDSRNQSTYYIAESGVHYALNEIEKTIEEYAKEEPTVDEFFGWFDSQFLKEHEFKEFESNFNENPKASIKVKHSKTEDNIREYEIESLGEIGNSSRTVSSSISIEYTEPVKDSGGGLIENLLYYTNTFNFHGNAIEGRGGTAVSDGLNTHNLNGGSALNISTMYFNGPVKMDGGSASFGNKNSPGTIYVNGDLELWNGRRDIHGDVMVKGNFKLKDAIINGNVYVNGDLELGWTPTVRKNIYYTGEIKHPNNYDRSILNKCVKIPSVDSWEVPVRVLKLRDNEWYSSNGYRTGNNGRINSGDKLYVDSFEGTIGNKVEGVVIVSEGDINLTGWTSDMTGALIAPNGKVSINQGNFTGLIIAKNGFSSTSGGSRFNLQSLEKFFGSEENMPVLMEEKGSEESGGGGQGGVPAEASITIKSSIKEL